MRNTTHDLIQDHELREAARPATIYVNRNQPRNKRVAHLRTEAEESNALCILLFIHFSRIEAQLGSVVVRGQVRFTRLQGESGVYESPYAWAWARLIRIDIPFTRPHIWLYR
jgi:hypothetical protein